jgi:hypothetical protein
LTHPEAIRLALERAHGGHWLPRDLQARRDGRGSKPGHTVKLGGAARMNDGTLTLSVVVRV